MSETEAHREIERGERERKTDTYRNTFDCVSDIAEAFASHADI